MRRRPSAAIVTPEACLRHDAVAVEDLLVLAPGMRPEISHADGPAALAGGTRQAVVAPISVELQRAVEAGKECLCILAAAARGIEEDRPWRIIAAPTSLIARKGPEITGLCPPSARVQRLNAAVRHIHGS